MAAFETKKKKHSRFRTISKAIIEEALRTRSGFTIAIAHINHEQIAYHKRFDTPSWIDRC